MIVKPSVAIGEDFLTAYSRINKNIKNRVSEFIQKFRENPRSDGINYEKI